MSERLVGGTRRADGTVRKEVKIRPGFKSEEFGERRIYKSRGVLEREQREAAARMLVGAPQAATPAPAAAAISLEEKHSSARAEKRKAKREAKKEAAHAAEAQTAEVTEKLAATSIADAPAAVQTDAESHAHKEEDPAKLLRKLKKKLKQIEELHHALTENNRQPSADESAKLAHRTELEKEIAQLEKGS